ncbi:MAG: lysophospholipid acyltransferase family protein [Candidatus Limnocylindrales bacterium]
MTAVEPGDPGQPVSPARRPRPQEARLAPEALAAARADAREGLDWLGRQPETKASLLYRSLRLLARAVFFGVFRFRVETSGQEHVPTSGGYLLVAAVHRGWMDPFLVQHALPIEPRAWFLGSAPTAFSSRWREWLLHRVGGMLPVWRGGVGIDVHVASAEAVLAAGGVFVIMAEGGIPGPPDRLAPFRSGSALIAIRTGAPIVPCAIVGSKELYVGRRMATRILPPTSAAALLGDALGSGDAAPEEGSRAELDLARRLTERLAAVLEPAVTELYPLTVDPPDRPRRFRGLTWLFVARPKGSRGQQAP